jgi:hypothetical protein
MFSMLITVHQGARINPSTVSISLPSAKSITVRVVSHMQYGHNNITRASQTLYVFNLMNSSDTFIYDGGIRRLGCDWMQSGGNLPSVRESFCVVIS